MIKRYKLSMTPGDKDVIVPVSQLDDGIRTIVFELINGGGDPSEYSLPENAEVIIEAIKPDKRVVSYGTLDSPEIITIVGAVVTVVPSQQMTVVAGNVFAKIKITDPNHTSEHNSIESSRIIFVVDSCPMGTDPDTSESVMNPLMELVQDAQEAAAEANVTVETVTGPIASITAVATKRYVCSGGMTLVSITPASDGVTDVIFTTASTGGVLRVPDTVLLPLGVVSSSSSGWKSITLAGGTTYEVNIMDSLLLLEGWENDE